MSHPSLGAALLAAQQSVEGLALDGRTQGRGAYRYASAEQIIAVCRDALHSAGLVLLGPTMQTVRVVGGGDMAEGRVVARTDGMSEVTPTAPAVVVESAYRLHHAASGESIELASATAEGATIDSRGVVGLGSACAGARTYGLRDLLRDLLVAPKGREEQAAAQRQPAPAPAPAPARTTAQATAPKPKDAPHVPGIGQTYGDAEPAQSADPAPTRVAPSLDIEEAMLRQAGWDPDTAMALCRAPDDDIAPSGAAVEVHRVLVGEIGLDATRRAWKGIGRDARAVCSGAVAISWGDVRVLALARQNNQGGEA